MPPAPAPVNRRSFLGSTAQGLLAAGAGVGIYAWRVEPHWIETTHHEMPLDNLPDAWAGKRLVQISDLHVGRVVSRDYLRGTLEWVKSLRPDVLVVTGDWMTCHASEQVEPTVDLIRGAKFGVPVVGILGNHDFSLNFENPYAAEDLTIGLRGVGVAMLRNEHIVLDGLQIGGVDDVWYPTCRIPATVAGLDKRRAAIMLCHNPDGVDRPGWRGFRGWVLSGHTHGGQCRLPGYGAFVLPVRNRSYEAGYVELGDERHLYVNRAIGYKQRVRFFARPEITVFTLAHA